MPSVRRVLGDAERVIEEGLHQRLQEQFLIRAMLQPFDAGEVEVRPVDFTMGVPVKPMNDACNRTSDGVKVLASVLDPVGVNESFPIYNRDAARIVGVVAVWLRIVDGGVTLIGIKTHGC